MLEAHGLHKLYSTVRGQTAAIADLDLRIVRGEFLALCGRSGSGKSTLLGMLGGLCRPSLGRVLLEGLDVWSLSADALAQFRNRRLGFVFQFASLLPTLRAVDNVALPRMVAGTWDAPSTYMRAAELLGHVGLADRASAYPAELSGGEQRRVALARALINEPPLLLADEPTGDLDEDTEAEIFELLLDLHHRRQTTLVIATHSPELARRADRVLHLRQGRVVSLGPPKAPEPEAPARAPARALRAEPTAPSSEAPLGAGFGRFLAGFAACVALVVLGLLAVHYGVALFQQRALAAKQASRKELEGAALKQLQSDIDRLTYDPDGSYQVTLFLQNIDPGGELYVLMSSVQVHVQVGRSWEEVPCRSLEGAEGRIIRLTDRQLFNFNFKPDLPRFEELIAGYMHVRISNTLLVSPRSEPTDDLVERADAFYVYLKPHQADDATILRRNGWSGKPPLWIPMPSH
jgi:putative ABC transport system ATP-binding protein/macrolide transport system ATP-binding/permease protein/lipoprotein-releasing system ATP-binding protein